ncbi:MAG: hypothetical protein AAF986_02115 [Pseudomonadota bacterium]
MRIATSYWDALPDRFVGAVRLGALALFLLSFCFASVHTHDDHEGESQCVVCVAVGVKTWGTIPVADFLIASFSRLFVALSLASGDDVSSVLNPATGPRAPPLILCAV